MSPRHLDFALLDDLGLAVERRPSFDAGSYLIGVSLDRVGPLIELAILERSRATNGICVAHLQASGVKDALVRALASDDAEPTHGGWKGRQYGFCRTARDPHEENQDHWTDFCWKAQQAADGAGVGKQMARQLIGALREIEENVHLHSERTNDGIVGYHAGDGTFEFAVADSGMGVLKSLQGNPQYASLRDHGAAIRFALTDGVSRFDESTGHGRGFHGLFVGLANAGGLLRFRSGDHTLTIDGAMLTRMHERLEQRPYFQGFSTSALCQLP